MKNHSWGMTGLVLVTASLLSFNFTRSATGKIKGQAEPSNAAAKAQAISMTDTFSVNILNGSFELRNVKEGVYTVYIKAIAPYRSTIKPGVRVSEGTTTDLGIIQLQADSE